MEKYEFGNPEASTVFIQVVGEHDLAGVEKEVAQIQKISGNMDFRLIAFKVNDWNSELSPWKAPAVFGDEDFDEGAEKTLDEILDYIAEINKETNFIIARSNTNVSTDTNIYTDTPIHRNNDKIFYIGGYSLAGLFSLWAIYRTDVFSGAAAASPSAWFPGFIDYMKNNETKSDKIYLSLGDKEEKTRNPVMSTVGDRIRNMQDLLKAQGKDCILEWNQGNHFREPDLRMAKGFSWLLSD